MFKKKIPLLFQTNVYLPLNIIAYTFILNVGDIALGIHFYISKWSRFLFPSIYV